MKNKRLSRLHLKVVNILKKENLTGFEILQRIKNTQLILNVYSALDDLSKKGILKSYLKKKSKVYYLSKNEQTQVS